MFKKAVALLLATSALAKADATVGQPAATEAAAPTDAVEETAEAPAVEETPAEEAPAEEEPAEEAPVEEAPAEEAPVEDEPVEEAPAEEAPVEEDPLTEMQQRQVDHIMNQMDFDGMETSVKERLTKQILEKELRREIEAHMNQQVMNVVKQYKDLEKKWATLNNEESESLNKLNTLTVKQMLKAIMTNLSTEAGRKELWKNSAPEDSDNLQDMNLDFNLKTGEIRVHSKATEPDGEEPLFDWNMNTNTGDIEEITRKDNRERIVERQVNPDTLKVSDDFFKIDLPKDIAPVDSTPEATTTEATAVTTAAETLATQPELGKPDLENMTEAEKKEWEQMEMQRDIAFKIMYFFIAFIIATFGLLYTYFKMSQQVEEDARREEMGLSRTDYEKQGQQKETFFDFLQGNMDNETYVGNPYVRQAVQQQQMSTQFQCDQMSANPYMTRAHRDNEGFGANNLETLMERRDEPSKPFAQYQQ